MLTFSTRICTQVGYRAKQVGWRRENSTTSVLNYRFFNLFKVYIFYYRISKIYKCRKIKTTYNFGRREGSSHHKINGTATTDARTTTRQGYQLSIWMTGRHDHWIATQHASRRWSYFPGENQRRNATNDGDERAASWVSPIVVLMYQKHMSRRQQQQMAAQLRGHATATGA